MQEVTVRSPATVANVVCGFDCLGFSLQEPFDEISVKKTPEIGIRIVNNDEFGLPIEPEKNVAGVAVKALLTEAKAEFGVEIISTKAIKPGSGIGSSAASAAGAVTAVNQLLEKPYSKADLIRFAMEGEQLASGARHADNVAPCIYGGFVLVRSSAPLDIVKLDFPPLWATIVHPLIEVKTSEARALLPKTVLLSDAVKNWSNLGAFVAALSKGDLDLMSRAMKDVIVEPARQSLIPYFTEVRAESMRNGAIGGGISGSGPSIFMLSETRENALKVEAAMTSIYADSGLEFNTYVSPIDPNGASIQNV